MSALLLDGNELATRIKAEVREKVADLIANYYCTPTLGVLRLSGDSASAGYSRAIGRACASVGIAYRLHDIQADVTQNEATAILAHLNRNPDVHGIMLLEPAPKGVDLPFLLNMLTRAKMSMAPMRSTPVVCSPSGLHIRYQRRPWVASN
ncbi:MAG: hypothetical protein HC802_04270 [Caldilineaceae bacterium]|nr:hypothetical protein [Caldilineaceae bacterium]